MPVLAIEPMGHINGTVGICGFVSALMAIHDADGIAVDAQGGVFQAATLPRRLFQEIHQCLGEMVAQNKVALIKDIEEFTRSFGVEYKKFTVAEYLNSGIDDVTPDMLKIPAIATRLSIAMPPEGVLFILQNKIGLEGARIVDVSADAPKYIVGVREGKNANATGRHRGLVHWMYVSGGKVYSWGNSYNSLAEAGDFVEVWRICVGVH
ncbi:MAG: hypothetical protein AAF608_10175 [Pseudomonadota bacterium]